jgi:hypothetical protein
MGNIFKININARARKKLESSNTGARSASKDNGLDKHNNSAKAIQATSKRFADGSCGDAR